MVSGSLGGVVCPLREEEAAPAKGVEGAAVEGAVWGEADAADDGGGVEGLAKVWGLAAICFARIGFAETRFARFQVALEWGGQLGTGFGGVEEAALLLQFGGFAKQGVGGVEALEIFGGSAAVVFTGEFEVVGGGVEQAEEVGGAEGLAAFAADGVVAGDELAMGGVGQPEGEQAFGVVAQAVAEGSFLFEPLRQWGRGIVETEQEAESLATEQAGDGEFAAAVP